MDEVQVPKRYWSKAPRFVSVALTNACNLKCHFCYAPKNPQVLDDSILIEWISELAQHGTHGIGFGGGEPTRYRMLEGLLRHIRTKTRMAATLTTHGHQFTERYAAKLDGLVDFIRISMDGIGSTYLSIRGKEFDMFVSKLEIISRYFRFGINYVVNKNTILDLPQALVFAENMGCKEFLILPERATAQSGGIDLDTFKLLTQIANRYSGSMPLLFSAGFDYEFPTNNLQESDSPVRDYVHIDASGTAKITSFDSNGVKIEKDGLLSAISKLGREYEGIQ